MHGLAGVENRDVLDDRQAVLLQERPRLRDEVVEGDVAVAVTASGLRRDVRFRVVLDGGHLGQSRDERLRESRVRR